MKTLIGCIIGAIAIAGTGFTYDVLRANMTENVIDVRIVEVGGHEYVVASSCTPHKVTNSGVNSATTYYGNKSASTSIANITGGGSSICIVHHVGCKACNKENIK